MSKVLSLKDIHKTYQSGELSVEVLKGVSLELNKGTVAALVGPSGSGKSTLLQIAGLLDAPSSGDVMIGEENVTVLGERAVTKLRNQSIGVIYQFHHLLAEFSALENVMMPRLMAGVSKAEAEEAASGLLEQVGLSGRVRHRPAELSGGEQQRVAIARALANSPDVLLADEPTGNLDSSNAIMVFDVLMKAAREQGVCALVATHNVALAEQMDEVYQMDSGTLGKQ